MRSRTTWFAVGALAGVLGAIGLVFHVDEPREAPPRTIVAGAATPGAYPTVAGALAVARRGDVVQLEPGVYEERIVVPEGVDLIARVPGSVTLRRPAGGSGRWVAVAAEGSAGGRVAGIRVESRPEAPIDVAFEVGGQGLTIELVEVTGAVTSALAVSASSSVVLRGSVLEVSSAAVRLEDGAHATLAHNVIVHAGRDRLPPLSLAPAAELVLRRNVLAGFGPVLVEGATTPVDLGGNFVLGSSAGRSAAR
jgi:hypothetical protein